MNLRTCVGPIAEARKGMVHQEKVGSNPPAIHPEDIPESESSDSDFVVVQEAMFLGLSQPTDGVDFESWDSTGAQNVEEGKWKQ